MSKKDDDQKIELRLLKKSDLSQLPGLFKAVFDIRKDQSFFEWKFFQNPAGGHIMIAALDKERDAVVGTVGTIPVHVSINGRKTLFSQPCDVAVLAEYKRSGLFYRMQAMATEEAVKTGVVGMFAYPNERVEKITVKMNKFRRVFQIKRLVRVLEPSPYIYKKIKSAPVSAIIGNAAGKLLRVIHRDAARLPKGYAVSEVTLFDGRFDEFMKRVGGRYGIMVYKDSGYLNWRYVRCESLECKVYAIERGGSIEGFTVVAVRDEDMRRGYILELLTDPDRVDLAEALLNRAVAHCYDSKASSVVSWSKEGSRVWGLMRKKGFTVKIAAQFLTARPHFSGEPPVDLADASLWDIAMGDSDYV